MNEVVLEFFVLGKVPGTEVVIGYNTSLIIAGILIMSISAYATLRYRYYVTRKLKLYSPEKLIDLKTI